MWSTRVLFKEIYVQETRRIPVTLSQQIGRLDTTDGEDLSL
jgi:hypothetical protein